MGPLPGWKHSCSGDNSSEECSSFHCRTWGVSSVCDQTLKLGLDTLVHYRKNFRIPTMLEILDDESLHLILLVFCFCCAFAFYLAGLSSMMLIWAEGARCKWRVTSVTPSWAADHLFLGRALYYWAALATNFSWLFSSFRLVISSTVPMTRGGLKAHPRLRKLTESSY